ncbi:MAG: hypothetical protein ACJ79H_19195 [Myxococcales bacterium]
MKNILLSTGPLAALLVCGCQVKYKDAGMLVATKVIQAKAASSGSTGCTYELETRELTFGIFNPMGGGYTHGLVIENRLADNADLTPGRLNTNDFQVEGADISYEQVDGPAVVMPAQTVSGNALIPASGKGITQLELVTPVIAQAIGGNTMKVRLLVQVFGLLLDGTRVRASTYEYVVQADPAFVLPAPACTAPAVAVACEGVNQDTGTGCQ